MKQKNSLKSEMAKQGIKIRTWGKSKGLSDKDILTLQHISLGLLKGKWGRAKELKAMLEQEGFKIV